MMNATELDRAAANILMLEQMLERSRNRLGVILAANGEAVARGERFEVRLEGERVEVKAI
jgi:hypothetical protein